MDVVSIIKRSPIIYGIYYYSVSIIVRIIRLFVRTDPKLILFVSFGGRYFNDNPKILYEAMLRDKRFTDYQLVWAFLKPNEINICTKKISINSYEYIKTALRARCWITNVSIERGLNFTGKKTFYLHTTHTYLPKCMGYDDKKGKQFKTKCHFDCSCAQSILEKQWQMSGYGIDEDKVLLSGYPKNDLLCNYSISQRDLIREKFNLKKDSKVILYAPTFRDELYGAMKCPIDFKKWERILGDKYVVLFRAHPVVANGTKIDSSTGFIYDVSTYPDNAELMIASDILISDYSGIFFEYAVQKKPMFCYAYDYDEYVLHRELYFDIRDALPGGMMPEDELLDVIKSEDYAGFDKKWKEFRNNYVSEYGHATDNCLNKIIDSIA